MPYLRLLRPKQWTKNGFVFAGLIFAGRVTEVDLLVRAGLAFLLFCAASSAVYVFNDILDRDEDRRHPLKSKRPIASGAAKVLPAVLLGVLLALAAAAFSWALAPAFFAFIAGYVAVNLVYSKFLKHFVILDVLIVAFGFVVRAAAGGVAVGVTISPWLLLCTTLLALFVAISKRRHELVLLGESARHHRRSLAEYSEAMLDQMVSVVTSSTVISYCLYTFTAHGGKTPAMMLTIPFVLYGVFRYLYIVYSKNEAGSPEEVLLKDRPLLVNFLAWAVSSAVIMRMSQAAPASTP